MNIIIDGLNIAFRSHHVYDVQQGLKTSDGVPTGIIYGFIKTLLKWKNKYPQYRIIVAWDCPTAKSERQKISPDYKANRDRHFESVEIPENYDEDLGGETMDIFTLQIEFLTNFLRSIGIDQIKAQGYEADDLIGTLVEGPLKEEQNIILSSDHDMMQLVSWSTILMTPSGKAYDPDKVVEKYGVSPDNLLTFRVFDGDKSDNMPGLPYFRRKVISRIVNEHEGNLESIYNSDIENLTAKEDEKLSSFEEQAHVNFKVMKLRTVEDYDFLHGEWNEDEIKGMCELFEFNTLRSDLLSVNKTNQGFLRYTNESLLHTTD